MPPDPHLHSSSLKNKGLFLSHVTYPKRSGKEYSFSDVALMTTTICPFDHQICYLLYFMHVEHTFPFPGRQPKRSDQSMNQTESIGSLGDA